MKQEVLDSLMNIVAEGLAPTLKLISDDCNNLNDRLKAAEAALAEATHRVNELELQKSKSFLDWYRGVHQPGNTYERGLLVTSDGSLWPTASV